MSIQSEARQRAAVGDRVDAVLGSVAESFRMDKEERQRFVSAPIARLIGSLPFLAGCTRAERTAIEHLGTYVLSVRETRAAFYAAPDDDASVYDRLAPIMRFDGGDPDILRRGMAILALNMVNDYGRDVDLDRMLGKHNPIGSGAWNLDSLRSELQSTIDSIDCEEMDRVVASGAGTNNFWSW